MENYTLTAESIDAISESVQTYLQKAGLPRRQILTLSLTIEEALLKYRDFLGEEASVMLSLVTILRRPRIRISVAGENFNPFEDADNPAAVILSGLLAGYSGTAPTWRYRNRINELTFYPPQKIRGRQTLLTYAIAVLGGFGLGFLARLLPEAILTPLCDRILNPLSGVFTSLITVMAVLATFFAIMLGIVHVGDISTLSDYGHSVLSRVLRVLLITLVIFTLLMVPLIPFGNTAGTTIDFYSVFDLLLGFVPSNPISPILNFDAGQLIILGIMFGVTMLILGDKVSNLVAVCSELQSVACTCNSFLNSRLVYYYVAINCFLLASTSDLSCLARYALYFLVSLGGLLLILVFFVLLLSRKLHLPLLKVILLLLPTFVINLSSANYGASFQTSFEKLLESGVDVTYLSLAHNLLGILQKPGHAIVFVAGGICAARMCSLQVNIGWLLLLVFLSLIFSCTLPTIPGAAISYFPVLFSQLGIPNDGLVMVLTMNVLLDFFVVAVNGAVLQAEILIDAYKDGKLDKRALKIPG